MNTYSKAPRPANDASQPLYLDDELRKIQIAVQSITKQFPNAPPSHSGSTGIAGSFAYDSTYLYVCVATNTWGRIAIDFTPF